MKAPESRSIPLFRREVVETQGAQHLGAIRIGRRPGFNLVALLSLGLAAALVVFSVYAEVTRKTRLPGLLVPLGGVIHLSSPQPGSVLEVHVKEGDKVAAGQTLMVIGTDRSTVHGETAALIAQSLQQRRRSLEAERHLLGLNGHQRQRALDERIRSLRAEALQARGELDAVQRRLQLASTSLQRYEHLAQSGFVAAIQTQQKQEELIELQIRERSMQRALTALARDVRALQADRQLNDGALQTQQAQVERGLAALAQEATENSARSRVVVTAPSAGRVSALSSNPGQTVQPGITLLSLLPMDHSDRTSDLQAHLFATGRTAGFVREGQTVWLRYAAYPYQKFGMAEGRIQSVSKTPIRPQDLPGGQAPSAPLTLATATNEPLYRVTVALKHQVIQVYGSPEPLKPGLALDADVVQDRRAVWEWVLDPILAGTARTLI